MKFAFAAALIVAMAYAADDVMDTTDAIAVAETIEVMHHDDGFEFFVEKDG